MLWVESYVTSHGVGFSTRTASYRRVYWNLIVDENVRTRCVHLLRLRKRLSAGGWWFEFRASGFLITSGAGGIVPFFMLVGAEIYIRGLKV